MVRVTSVLLLAAACLSLVSAACDKDIVSKILSLRKGKQDSNILNIVGEHYIAYVSGSSSVPQGYSNDTCVAAKYSVGADGKHRVELNGINNGNETSILDWDKDHEVKIDPTTGKPVKYIYVVYAQAGFNIVANYICSVSGPDTSLGVVSVASVSLDDTLSYVADAKRALTKVGLGVGEVLTGCNNVEAFF